MPTNIHTGYIVDRFRRRASMDQEQPGHIVVISRGVGRSVAGRDPSYPMRTGADFGKTTGKAVRARWNGPGRHCSSLLCLANWISGRASNS